METILAFLTDNIWVQVLTIVVTAASGILILFPVPAQGSALWYVRKVIEWLALNLGQGKNATTDKGK